MNMGCFRAKDAMMMLFSPAVYTTVKRTLSTGWPQVLFSLSENVESSLELNIQFCLQYFC